MEMEMMMKTKMETVMKKKTPSPTTTRKGKRNRTCPSCFCMLDPICYGWHIKKCSFYSSSSGDSNKNKTCEEKPELFLSVDDEEETKEEKQPHPDSISHMKPVMASQSVANNEEEIMDSERPLFMKAENEHALSQKLKEKMEENQLESILCVKGLKSTENSGFSEEMKDLEEKLRNDSERFLYVKHLISTISALKEENDALSQKVKSMEENLHGHSESFSFVHGLKSTISDSSADNKALSQKEKSLEKNPHSDLENVLHKQGLTDAFSDVRTENDTLFLKMKSLEENPHGHSESDLHIQGLKSSISEFGAQNDQLSQKLKYSEENAGLKSTISALKAENDALFQKVNDLEGVKEGLLLQLRLSKESERRLSLIEFQRAQVKEKKLLHQGILGFSPKCLDIEPSTHFDRIKSSLSAMQHGMENPPCSVLVNVQECFHQEERTMNDEKDELVDENQKDKTAMNLQECCHQHESILSDERKMSLSRSQGSIDNVERDNNAENDGFQKNDILENNVFQKDDHAEDDDAISTVGALQCGNEKPPCSQSHNVQMCLNQEERVLNDEKGKLVNQGQGVKDDCADNSARPSQHGAEKPQFGQLCDLVTMHEYSNKEERVIKGEIVKLVGQSQEEKDDNRIILQYGIESPQCSQSQDLVNLHEHSHEQERVLNGEQEKLVDQSQEEKVDFQKDDNLEKKEELDLDQIVSLACGEEAYLHDFLVEVDARVKSGKQGDVVDTLLLLEHHESALFGHDSPLKSAATDAHLQSGKTPEKEVIFPSFSESSMSSLCANKAKTHSRRRVMFISESESENESIHQNSSSIETSIRESTSKANELSDIGTQSNKIDTVSTAFKRALDIDFDSEESSYLCALRRSNKIEALQNRALKDNCTPNWSSNASQHNSKIDGYELSSDQRRKRLRTLSILSTLKDLKTETSLVLNKDEESSLRHGKAFRNVLGTSSRTRKQLFEDKCRNEGTNEGITSSSLDGFVVSSDEEGSKSSDGSDSTSRTWLFEDKCRNKGTSSNLDGFIVSSDEEVSKSSDGSDSTSRTWLLENNDQNHNTKSMRDLKMRNYAWDYEAEMLSVLDTDDELCLRAVCALNRRQTEDEQHEKISKYLNKRGFNSSHAARASRYAEFLTDGNPSGPGKKSVKNLEKYDPSALKYCRMLTFIYSKQLFDMYVHDDDPYFPC